MKNLRLWAKAVRPYAYSASLVPVAIGGLYARASGAAFSEVRLVAALACGVLLHTAANLWNDYFDFKGGVDRMGGGEGSGVLVHGEMTPARCFRGATVCAVLGLLVGIWLAVEAGRGLWILLAAGLVGALAYSAGPLSPKHRAMGEVWVFLMMGVGMTLGGYMAQTGRLAWGAILAGIPAGLLMTLILYANNLRDIPSDRAAGLRTLPMLLRPPLDKGAAGLLLASAYLLTLWLVAARHLPPAVLLTVFSLPPAIRWMRRVWRRPVGEPEVVGMAMLHMLFGGLFAAGLGLAPEWQRWFP